PSYPCHTYSSASGSVCCLTEPSQWVAFLAKTNWDLYPLAARALAIFSLASTQSCMSSSIELGLSRSLSPTSIQRRSGLRSALGMIFACTSQAPPGVSLFHGHCWLTKV